MTETEEQELREWLATLDREKIIEKFVYQARATDGANEILLKAMDYAFALRRAVMDERTDDLPELIEAFYRAVPDYIVEQHVEIEKALKGTGVSTSDSMRRR